MNTTNDITITSLETIDFFDVATGAYRFTLDELQNAKIANSQDTTEITGKGGRKLNSLKKNKAVTVSGTNGLVSGGLLELQTGGRFVKKDTAPIKWADYLTITSNAATTSYKAVGTIGNEIETVYIKNSDGTLGAALTQDASASAGKFAYDPATRIITFASGAYTDGTEIAVFYTRNIKADVLENYSDTYSEKCKMYVNAFGEDKCNNVYRIQFYIPRADFSGNFDIDLGDNQTVHAFEAESLAGACGAGGTLWTYTVFGANEVDAPSLSSIAVTTAPTKTAYTAGEAFNSAGMVVTATYTDGSTKVVTGYVFAPVSALTADNTAITITYSEGGITKTATQAITVTAE